MKIQNSFGTPAQSDSEGHDQEDKREGVLRGCAERGVLTQHRWGYKPVLAIVVNSTGVSMKSKMGVGKIGGW